MKQFSIILLQSLSGFCSKILGIMKCYVKNAIFNDYWILGSYDFLKLFLCVSFKHVCSDLIVCFNQNIFLIFWQYIFYNTLNINCVFKFIFKDCASHRRTVTICHTTEKGFSDFIFGFLSKPYEITRHWHMVPTQPFLTLPP